MLKMIPVALLLVTTAAAPVAVRGLERKVEGSNPTVAVSNVKYKGRAALRAIDTPQPGVEPLLFLPVRDFRNGIIEAEVAGLPAPGAAADVRGFVGIAFRVQAPADRYEAFYIRPTNGRADDQLRRNHSTQYISSPDHPWHKLRKEQPGVYESYADMAAGEWTRLRIEVDGAKARLFVGRAVQPSLIVNDLKLGADSSGRVALWIGPGTEAYFANVTVTRSGD